ncbi:S8 family serine peptidase [Ferruginibacter yonginensis]|uniref:S8 family serine peptidase n=1 Tax=Ferruginibacter yonginensis TaxID=1310416 RepID=A0ABV8QSG4_9BACT
MKQLYANSNKILLHATILLVTVLVAAISIFGVPQPIGKKFKLGGSGSPLLKDNFTSNDDDKVIYLNAIQLNTALPSVQTLRSPITSFVGKRMHLVKFATVIQPAYLQLLKDADADVIDYIPNYTYLIYANSASIQQIQQAAKNKANAIDWEGAYLPAYKIAPDVFGKDAKGAVDYSHIVHNAFQIQLYADDATNYETVEVLKKLSNGQIINVQRVHHYVNIDVKLDAAFVEAIANRPDVISIHPYLVPKKQDESQAVIMTGQITGVAPSPSNYLDYLVGKGFSQAQFDASGFVVNVTDDGLDSGSVANVPGVTSHFGLYKNGDKAQTTRVAFVHKQGTATDADTRGCDGHGNLNAHIIGGYIPNALIGNANHADVNGFRYGLGIAPFVKVGNSTIFNVGGTYNNPVFSKIESESYRDAGRISSNSWGANVAGAYTTDAQAYDFLVRDAQPTGAAVAAAGNQEMVILFSAGNAGSGVGTIGSPGTGKNVITVGASEGVRAFGGADGCAIADVGANNAFDIISFSSRGPCTDGRKKPDIVAPGTHITGGVYQSNVATVTTGNGSAAACFNGSGVCGGVGSNFFPGGTQRWYTASSGTSHSTPAVAGFAALIRQDFINNAYTPPSPAMTKAMILASAGYMNGTGANDNLFSNNQGMGLVNMNNYFNIVNNPLIIRDQLAADVFTASGQVRTFTGVIANTGLPLRITMAYTDAPGSTAGNSYVNNLDVEVIVNGQTYLGNVFTGANSTPGGIADVRNNVESVFLPAGTSGTVVVRVKATNIAGDGIPNFGTALDQDFSLVVSNTNTQAVAAAQSAGPTITAESCGTGFIPDPQELITVSLPITNVGTLSTSNLVATLQSSADIVFPSAPQSYGALAPNASDTKNFSFYINNTVACGNVVSVTWQLTDGATNMGTITKTYNVGAPVIVGSQNFDAVTAPALPAGWVQSQLSGTAINWVTSTTTPNSAPNTAFVNDPTTVNSTALISPVFNITGSGAVLSFNKAYTLESTYDGVVLEMKIGAGAFTDIVTAGGVFITGGYIATLNNTFGNPIGGRQAWTGASTTFTPTQVTLPASTIGQTVQFRWIMGSDNSTGSVGFRLDDVVLTGGIACNACFTLPLNLLSFTGVAKDGFNLLQWNTSNEINTHSFELQYSYDAVFFQKAYTIAANGSGAHNYQQRDNGVWIKTGLMYYRLKMIDNDGRFTYSNIITIRNNKVNTIPTVVYPNPVKEKLTVSIGDQGLLGTNIQLFDATGKLIQTVPIYFNTVYISLTNYSTGMYILKLANGENIKINKL